MVEKGLLTVHVGEVTEGHQEVGQLVTSQGRGVPTTTIIVLIIIIIITFIIFLFIENEFR